MKNLTNEELIAQLKDCVKKYSKITPAKTYDLYTTPELAVLFKSLPMLPMCISEIHGNPYIEKYTVTLCPHGKHPITPPKRLPKMPYQPE